MLWVLKYVEFFVVYKFVLKFFGFFCLSLGMYKDYDWFYI